MNVLLAFSMQKFEGFTFSMLNDPNSTHELDVALTWTFSNKYVTIVQDSRVFSWSGVLILAYTQQNLP